MRTRLLRRLAFRLATLVIVGTGCLTPTRVWAQAVVPTAPAAPAPAQPRPTRPAHRTPWRLTFRVGGGLVDHPTSGISALPLSSVPLNIISGSYSEVVPSWFFGSGTSLLNGALQARGKGQVQMAPLDTMLTTATVSRRTGAAFGASISRQLGRRYRLSFTMDGAEMAPTFNAAGLAAIEASRASYVTAFTTLINGGQINPPSVTATSAVTSGGGLELTGSGTVDIILRATAKSSWFVTVGGGVTTDAGTAPSATLVGHTAFTFGPASLPIDQTDTVTIQSVRSRLGMGLVGGGWTWDLTPRWGLTADVRLALSGSGVKTLVSASPTQVLQSNPNRELILIFTGAPGVVFDNAGVTGAPSSLSTTPLSSFPTFVGTGLQIRTLVNVGLSWRF